MKIKEGAKLAGIRPEIVVALIVADGIYREAGVELVVTEATGGVHGRASLHYVGLAVDLRTRDLTPAKAAAVAATLRSSLGDGYDVVLESDHIHIEYQPK